MQKNHKYTFESRIRFSEVDHTKRITLPGIINYFQDCSTFHSESLGVGIDYCAKHKRAWILSAWQVIVERYPMMGEPVSVSTWATEFQGLYGIRNFCMQDAGKQNVAYANSVWVYMDMEKGRPVKPDEQEIALYGSEEPLEMEYASRKIDLPKETIENTPFPVRKYHIDTNELAIAEWLTRDQLPRRDSDIALTSDMIEAFRTKTYPMYAEWEGKQGN